MVGDGDSAPVRAPAPPPVAGPRAGPRGKLALGYSQRRLLSFTADLSELPIMGPGRLATHTDGGFAFRQSTSGYLLEVPDLPLAEVEIGARRYFTSGPVPRSHTMGPLIGGMVELCVQGRGEMQVEWTGVRKRRAEAIEVSQFIGSLDGASCRAGADYVRSGRLSALLPSAVYAARKCDDPRCREPDQRLFVVTPPSRWVGATMPDSNDLLTPHTGSFTRLELPLTRGRAASATLQVSADHLKQWGASLPELLGTDRLLLTIDAVWPSERDSAALTLSLWAFDGGEGVAGPGAEPSPGVTLLRGRR